VKKGDTLGGIATHWRSSVTAIKSLNKMRSDTIRPGQVLTLPVRSWLTRYSWTTLRKGDRNRNVFVLQTALRMKTTQRTGTYGPLTERRVIAFKKANRWKANDIVGPRMWRKLGA
jgi:LysM repeat protein